jgi:transcriptional regulator with XRE-family HTH domain
MKAGDRIKELRESIRMNQKTLAEKINVTSQVMSTIENNKQNITNEQLIKLSETLNVSIGYILTGREEANTIKEDEAELLEIYRHDAQLKELLKKIVETKKKMINYILKELPIAA